ncbi:hypothetical protein Tco_0930086 [Tanacetum coccineum]
MFIPRLITMTLSNLGKEKLFKCNIRESLSRLNNCHSTHILPAQIWDVPGPEGMYGNNSTYTTEGYGYVNTQIVPPNMVGPDLNGKAVNESQYREKALQMLASCLKASLFAKVQISTILYKCSELKHEDIVVVDTLIPFFPTQYQLADIFTKPLDEPTFKRLIVKLGGKTGGFDQITNKDAIILYSLANRINIDYASILWEDIIIILNKKHREKVVPYTRFLSLLMMHKMKEGYGDGELTLYPTQVVNINN